MTYASNTFRNHKTRQTTAALERPLTNASHTIGNHTIHTTDKQGVRFLGDQAVTC